MTVKCLTALSLHSGQNQDQHHSRTPASDHTSHLYQMATRSQYQSVIGHKITILVCDWSVVGEQLVLGALWADDVVTVRDEALQISIFTSCSNLQTRHVSDVRQYSEWRGEQHSEKVPASIVFSLCRKHFQCLSTSRIFANQSVNIFAVNIFVGFYQGSLQ